MWISMQGKKDEKLSQVTNQQVLSMWTNHINLDHSTHGGPELYNNFSSKTSAWDTIFGSVHFLDVALSMAFQARLKYGSEDSAEGEIK